jgi:hypothetical protein
MLAKIFYSKTAAALATWLAILTAVFGVLVWLTPEWFGHLSWAQTILVCFTFALATLFVLALTASLFANAFRLMRPVPASEVAEELVRVSERVKRAEERLDGAQVVSAVGVATGTSKGLRLTAPERDKISASLLSVDAYLANDFAEFLRPYKEVLNYEVIASTEGGAALHRMIEGPRSTMRQFIDQFMGDLKPYLDDLDILDLDVAAIKRKALPLWDASWHLASATGMLPDQPTNPASFSMQGKEFSRVVHELMDEVERVRRDIRDWRKKIARGEV